MYSIQFYSRLYNPSWGYISIIKGNNASWPGNLAKISFEALFDELKASNFNFNMPQPAMTEIQKEYLRSVYGNYEREQITYKDFKLLRLPEANELIEATIENSFLTEGISDRERKAFCELVMNNLSFAVKDASQVYQFSPQK